MALPGPFEAIGDLVRHLIDATRHLIQGGADIVTVFTSVPVHYLEGELDHFDVEKQAELYEGARESVPQYFDAKYLQALSSHTWLTNPPAAGSSLAQLEGFGGFGQRPPSRFAPIGVAFRAKPDELSEVKPALLSVDSLAGNQPWALLRGPEGLRWAAVSPSIIGTLKPVRRPSRSTAQPDSVKDV